MRKYLGVSLLALLVSSPALAETCVTGVTSTATNAVTNVNAQTGQVVGSVTPTFANALTGINTQTGQVVGSVTPTFASAVTSTPVTTTPITHATAFTQVNVLASSGQFYQNGQSDVVNAPNPPGIQNVNVILPTATATTNVVTAVNPTSAQFVNGVISTPTNAVTSVTSANAAFVNGVTATSTNAVTGVTTTNGQVVGSVAAGNSGAVASTGSIGCGPGASANGVVSTAFGAMASANHDNATALGAGATTTRPNQVVVGTATNTYTLPGINSAASRAAQSGDIRFVTADSQGNLATADVPMTQQTMLNLVNIATAMTDLQGRVANLEQAVFNLRGDVQRSNEGVALSIAMGGGWLPDDKIFAIATNYGNFSSQSALAVSGYYRVNRNVVVNAGVGYGFRYNGVGTRVGALMAW